MVAVDSVCVHMGGARALPPGTATLEQPWRAGSVERVSFNCWARGAQVSRDSWSVPCWKPGEAAPARRRPGRQQQLINSPVRVPAAMGLAQSLFPSVPCFVCGEKLGGDARTPPPFVLC